MDPEQLPLIPSYAPKARITDPETSQRAGELGRMRGGSMRAKLLLAFYDARYDQGLTDEEAARHAGVSLVSEYATRCSELRRQGLIVPTGEERLGAAGVEREVSEITGVGIVYVRDSLQNAGK